MNTRSLIRLSVIILLASLFRAEAQTMVMHVDRAEDTLPRRTGQNLARFSQLYLQAGFVAGTDEAGARIRYGNSMDFAIGYRKKYKVSGVYSLGWEIDLRGTSFRLVQDSGKTVPNNLLNNRERLTLSMIAVGFYQRFNFDPSRGNHIGTYLDLGASAAFQTMQHLLRNKLPDGSVANTAINKVPYDQPFGLRLNARIGRGHLALFGSYCLTDRFKSSFDFPELPRLVIGLELGIYP